MADPTVLRWHDTSLENQSWIWNSTFRIQH